MNDLKRARETLFSIYQAALERVSGRETVKRWLIDSDRDCSMIAIGKAAGDMAQGAVDQLGNHIIDGWVISKFGHLEHKLLQSCGLETMEAGHPVPDQQSLAAGARLLDYLEGLPEDRPLLFLISGGASSLIEVLRPGITLTDLERVNKWLLASGLSITDMNRVRCSLSLIKGGGLLRYIGRRPVDVLLISDVPKDDPAVIGSGLLVPPADGVGLPAYLKLPEWILALTADTDGTVSPPTVGDNVSVHVIASLRDAREAAAAKARMLGYEVTLRHAHICADAVTAGRRLALELNDADPGIFIWGGEPSVQLPKSPGRGGRNQHLALSAATVIAGHDDVYFLSLATDGGDGPGDDAGALVDGGTVRRGEREGFNAKQALDAADSGSFLEASGDLINTGPTGTNVMDLILGIKL
ncbi:MAG: DUF4147 domain-containing protein [Candidatus Sedimenticola sp. (ex Thyasira tokunagai)]